MNMKNRASLLVNYYKFNKFNKFNYTTTTTSNKNTNSNNTTSNAYINTNTNLSIRLFSTDISPFYNDNIKDGKNILENSSTHENLKQAFAEESMACLRYLYFSKIAEKEGFIELTEQEHCFRWLAELQTLSDPLTNEPFGDTFANLNVSIMSESMDSKNLYPRMASMASSEGFTKIAYKFIETSIAEGRHLTLLKKALAEINKSMITSQK